MENGHYVTEDGGLAYWVPSPKKAAPLVPYMKALPDRERYLGNTQVKKEAPSHTAVTEFYKGKGIQKVLTTLLLRSVLIGTGLAIAGDKKHLVKNALVASTTIEVFLFMWLHPSRYNPHDLTKKWLDSICSGNIESVLSNYDDDAVLVGTIAQTIKRGKGELRGYFDGFMAKSNLCGKINSYTIQHSGNIAIDSGIYTFSWTENGEPQSVVARYSFVYEKTPKGWKILSHHSSALPE